MVKTRHVRENASDEPNFSFTRESCYIRQRQTVIVDHVDYRRAMGKRDLLSGLRGPAAHWPASLSLSTKQYHRGGNFLLDDDVTSLIRLRAGAIRLPRLHPFPSGWRACTFHLTTWANAFTSACLPFFLLYTEKNKHVDRASRIYTTCYTRDISFVKVPVESWHLWHLSDSCCEETRGLQGVTTDHHFLIFLYILYILYFSYFSYFLYYW